MRKFLFKSNKKLSEKKRSDSFPLDNEVIMGADALSDLSRLSPL